MLRKMILSSDTAGEITLPVTPESYNVSTEMSVQVIDVYELGQYAAPTYPALQTIKIECLLPSSARSYCVSYTEQSSLVKWLNARLKEKTRLRYIVSGTAVNVPVYLVGVEYGEKDGTNDIYASLTLREYRTLSAPEVLPGTSGTAARETSPQQNAQGAHIVKHGDTLWAIAKKHYGDGSLCYKLAAYNGIKTQTSYPSDRSSSCRMRRRLAQLHRLRQRVHRKQVRRKQAIRQQYRRPERKILDG